MQRQSLGSPGSKHQHQSLTNGEKTAETEHLVESKRVSISTSSLAFNNGGGDSDEEEKTKLLKTHRSSTAVLKNKSPEKVIHGIPVLTLVCFLILYLSSHDPSQSEMEAFGGLRRAEVVVIDLKSVMDSSKSGEAVENRRLMNLREIQRHAAVAKSRVHRKLGHF